MSLDDLTEAVRRKLGENPSLGHTVLIDLGDDGVIMIDGTVNPAIVGNERGETETILTLSAALFGRMLAGEGGATMAYMSGKLKIAGSMGVALKLNAMMEE